MFGVVAVVIALVIVIGLLIELFINNIKHGKNK
jgi:hypothetical protein